MPVSGPTLWLSALIGALAAGLGRVVAFLPALLGAILILLIGWGIGKMIQWLITRALCAVHFNDLTERAGINDALRQAEIKSSPAGILGIVAYWFVFLIAIFSAINALGITTLTTLMASVVLYLPRIFGALLVVVVGAWGASLLGRLTRASAAAADVPYAGVLGSVVTGATLFFTFAVALDVLGLSFPFLTTAFAILLGGAVLTAVLAFGLGGRQYAADMLAGRELLMVFQPGDRIRAENLDGTVQAINPTFTVVRTLTGDLTIQNADLMARPNLVKTNKGMNDQGGMSQAA